MPSAGPSREGMEMRQASTHPVSIAGWTPNMHEGPSSSTSPPGSLQYEAFHRVKAARKPLRSSPLAGPALSGERPSICTQRASTLPSRASPSSFSFIPRSILLAEPLSCFLRPKPSHSDMKRPSLQISTGSSSRPTSSSEVPPVRLSPSPSPPALGHSKTSARYRASVSDSGVEGAASGTTITSSSRSQPKRLSINMRHISIARPPPVIISPTESAFCPQSDIIYTQQSGSLSAPPHTPPHSRSRHGERTTMDAHWREASDWRCRSASPTSPAAEPSPPISPLRLPSPTQPKSILKRASSSAALRHSSGVPLRSYSAHSSEAAATGLPQAKTPPKDNSWFVNSPYAITPRFTRLGLNAPGVVLPLSVKEYKRRTTTAASLAGAGSMSTKSSGGSSVRSSTSSKMSRRASSPSTFSLAASVTRDNAHPDPVDIESHGGPRPRSAVGMSAETPNEGKSSDKPSSMTSSSPASTSRPSVTEAQPHWLSLPPYSQSQSQSSAPDSQSHSHAEYESEPHPKWTRAESQCSAASSESSLPLTLPSSVPDSTTLASSQTPSVLSESQTETSSVCTSVDEKSEETALPLHGARAGEEGEREGEADKEAAGDVGAEGEAVTVTVEIPSLRLKKRRSMLEKVKSFCWTSTDTSAEDDKASRAQYGATNVVNLPLPAVAAAASSLRRSNARQSLPLMALNSSGDTWVVPELKGDATRPASNSKACPLEPLGGVAPQVPAATLPTIREAEGQSHRLSGRTRRGTEKTLNDSDVGVEVRYLDMGIVDSGIRKARSGHRRNGSVRKVWESLRGGRGSRGPQTSV